VKDVRALPAILGAITIDVAARILGFGPLAVIAYFNQPLSSVLYWSTSLPMIVLAGALGGFVATRESCSPGFRTAFVAAALFVAVRVGFAFFSDGIGWATWMTGTQLALVIPAALLGARVASRAGRTGSST